MKRVFSVILLAGLVAGCATSPPARIAFDHATATQVEFLQDRYDCLQASMGLVAFGDTAFERPNGSLYENCMVLRGYTRNDETGRLVVPEDLRVSTY